MSQTLQHKNRPKAFGIEMPLLVAVLMALVFSVGILCLKVQKQTRILEEKTWMIPDKMNTAEGIDPDSVLRTIHQFETPAQSTQRKKYVFSSEPRVVAVGSALPIPFEAMVCPFSGVVQPRMDELDRDGDEMPDVWEEKHGLNKYKPADACQDLDGDGFTNLEEYRGNTNPQDPESHPASAAKLRFLESKAVMFKFKFQAVTDLPDGKRVFQLNLLSHGRTYFKEQGESIEGMVIKSYLPQDATNKECLVLMRGEHEIILPKEEVVREPENRAELINLLDGKTKIVTMGELLSICDDVYVVVDIGMNNATVRLEETGELFRIVKLTDEERLKLFGGFVEKGD